MQPSESEADVAIRVVQAILEMDGQEPGTNLIASLDDVVCAGAWRSRRSSNGGSYDSFGDFAIDPPPSGLGVRNERAFRLVRFALLDCEHYREFTDLLECCVRGPGRPSNNLVEGENFHITVLTGENCLDRILLNLKRKHPDVFSAVCDDDLTPREGARRAGLLPARERRSFGACDFVAASQLPKKAQAKLIISLFKALPVDAQCALLSRVIEPALGQGLAGRWRKLHTKPSAREGVGD